MKGKSPAPVTSITKGAPKNEITFPQAMEEIVLGKRISKREWADPESYGFMNADEKGNSVLSLHMPDGKNVKWIISWGDLIGEDYFVI